MGGGLDRLAPQEPKNGISRVLFYSLFLFIVKNHINKHIIV